MVNYKILFIALVLISFLNINVLAEQSKYISLGEGIASNSYFSTVLNYSNLPYLQNMEFSFMNNLYSAHEEVVLGFMEEGNTEPNGTLSPILTTSLISGDDDYESNVYMNVPVKSINYYYIFDEPIDLTEATIDNPVKINFLGQDINIVGINSDNEFVLDLGISAHRRVLLNLNDSNRITVDGKNLTLISIENCSFRESDEGVLFQESDGVVTIDVDGETDTISYGETKIINGIEIKNDDGYCYREEPYDIGGAYLVIEYSTPVFKDGDYYFGGDCNCLNNNPKDMDCWRWVLSDLKVSDSEGDIYKDTNGPTIGVTNRFVINDDKDKPPTIGDCVNLPNNYSSICLDSLNIADTDYANYKIIYENETIKLSSLDLNNGFEFQDQNGTGYTDTILLRAENLSKGEINVDYGTGYTSILTVNNNFLPFAKLSYNNTKFDIGIYKDGGSYWIRLNPNNETIDLRITNNTLEFNGLGNIDKTLWELREGLVWTYGSRVELIGNKNEDHRTVYGIIIKASGTDLEKNELNLRIPKEQNGSSFDSYYFYDGFGKLVQSKTESENEFIVKDIYYDNFTRILKESDPYFSSYSFNYTSPNSSIPLIKYTYDTVGRTTKVVNPDNTEKNIVYDHWNVANYDENNNRKDFVLDAYGKIINITEHTGEEDYHTSYYYDGSGNLISIVDSKENVFSFDYDSLGRKILSYNPDTGWTNYTYDSLGNLIKQVSGSGNLLNDSNYEREYNNFGQMIRISYLNNSLIEEYTYDPNGMRIKTYNYKSNTTTYTPFKEFMQIRNSSGVFNYTYVYEGDTLVVKINPDGSKSYYHPDHLGSTTLITNQSGSIVEEISYYPHGKPVEDSAEIKLYESKEYNDELEQYYYGARYYDPNLMIFIQPDSLIPDIYDPQQLNIYSFERNNPYKYVDKDGNAIQLAAVAYFAWKVWNACLTLAPLVYDIQQGNQITTEQTFYAFADTAIGFIPVFGDLVIDVPQTISALNEGLNNYVMNDETSVGFSQYLVEEAPNAIVESLNKDPKQKNIKEFLFLYEGDKSDRLLSFLYNYGSLTKEGDSGSQYVCYKGMCFYLSQNNYKKYTELIKNKNLYYEDDAENDESEMEEEDEKK